MPKKVMQNVYPPLSCPMHKGGSASCTWRENLLTQITGFHAGNREDFKKGILSFIDESEEDEDGCANRACRGNIQTLRIAVDLTCGTVDWPRFSDFYIM